MKVTSRFLLLLIFTFASFIAFSVWLTYHFSRTSREGSRLVQNLQETIALNQALSQGLHSQLELIYRQFEALEPSFQERFGKMLFKFGQSQARYLRLDIGDEERLTIEDISNLHAEFEAQASVVFSQLRTGDIPKARKTLQLVQSIAGKIDAAFLVLMDVQIRKLGSVLDQLSLSVEYAYGGIYVLAGGLVIVLFVFTFLLDRLVLQRLRDLQSVSEKICKGDFSVRASTNRIDEIGLLAQGFNYMAASLTESYGSLERKVEERTRQLQLMQEQLVRSEKMSAVGRLVGGVAHELNNPLTVVMGYAELVKQRIASSTPADAKLCRMLDDVLQHADRCRRIVANLLQFARQAEPHLEPVNMHDVLEQVCQLREYEFRTQNIELIREYDSGNPVLYGDFYKLQQVILNLLNNAYDAIQEGGGPGRIWLCTQCGPDKVTIEIRDNGTGISELSRVFDPFFTTKEVGKGTGLGLSVCYGIVEEHNGEILAQNWEQGARFIIHLPIGKPGPAIAPCEASRSLATTLPECTALVVDDEEDILQLQVEFLKRMGIRAHGVTSGEKALRHLEEHQVDLIVSDVRMPGIPDGVQLYDWIKAYRPHLVKRFLFVTGDTVAVKTGSFFQQFSIPYLQKPFQYEEFSSTIRKLIES